MLFNRALEGAELMKPARWIGRTHKDLIPALGCLHCSQATQKGWNPGRNIGTETCAYPVSFRVCRAARVGLHQARAVETRAQDPENVQRGGVLRVEQFQNHRTTGPK